MNTESPKLTAVLSTAPSLVGGHPSPRPRSLVPDVLVPGGLVLLSVVPVLAGVVRLVELGSGGEVTPDNARFFAAPLPAVVHIVSGSLFCLGGAFQFSPALRRRGASWHRLAGRVLLPLGFAAALSALWLTALYPPAEHTGLLLKGVRAVAGSAMLASLSVAVLALFRRRFVAHGEWMIRGYALGIAAGTQVFTHVGWLLFIGTPGERSTAALMGAGWVVNLVVAEHVIRGGRRRRASASSLSVVAHTPRKMKAVVVRRYGGPEVIALEDVDIPVPGRGQVLVQVHATSINAADYRVMRADPFLVRLSFGLFRPKQGRLGLDVAGVVEAVGPGVESLRVGEEVFGEAYEDRLGAFAEHVVVGERALAKKPAPLSFSEAAAVPLAARTALQAVRDRAKLTPSDTVLIHGAGGGVGTFLVQLAKARGAHVTALCGPGSVELVRSLGADRVLDYTHEDFTKRPERYDVIFGVNGYRPLGDYLAGLSKNGLYLMVGGTTRQIFDALLFGALRSRGGRRIQALTLDESRRAGDLEELRALLETGRLRPVIDRVYSFADMQPALRYVEGGHVRGKVVVDVRPAVRRQQSA